MNRLRAGAYALILFSASMPAAWAGSHAVAHYPSYYPDEIRIDVLDPAAAAEALAGNTLHVYLGGTPAFAGPAPAHVKTVESLAALLVLRFVPGAAGFESAEHRCAAARDVTARLSVASAPGFVFHPYPVTPYHADYLHHVDRIAAAPEGATAVHSAPLRVAARGPLAADMLGEGTPSDQAQAALEEVPIDALIGDAALQMAGWLGPPWHKEGWYHAHRLMASSLDGDARRAADDVFHALIRGETIDLAEQADLERRLVAMLTRGCESAVVGYAVRREFINDEFSAGVENVGHDSRTGIVGPLFIRTVKLKDFPWNGSARVGVPRRAEAAWNPIAGFTDPAGRLIWAALSDPAMISFPTNGSWIANRIQTTVAVARGQSGGITVPADALQPEPRSGKLIPIAGRTLASAKVTYEVIGSPYLDGTGIDMADVLYPFIFAFRATDRGLVASLSAIRDRVVAVRPVRTDKKVQNIAPGIDVTQTAPVVEVYLKETPGDDHQVAALAPAWSAIPWHLFVLMEEAVRRGQAAFSEQEARERGIPWLDLVRDKVLHAKLMAMVEAFAKARFRPDALAAFVSAEEAEGRWRALQKFGRQHGHLLVTNGPYRLKSWDNGNVVLAAVREATYPLGFGTFDIHVNVPRAAVREVRRDGNRIVVAADADIPTKVSRHYEIKREPLTRKTAQGTRGVLVSSRYLLVGPQGNVVQAGRMRWDEDNLFSFDLPARLTAGRHVALVGIFLDGNLIGPTTAALAFQAEGRP